MLLPSIFANDFDDDFFDDFCMQPFNYSRGSNRKMQMKSDLKEFDDKYELKMQLPGFSKDDVKAELKNGYLTISASHEETKSSDDKADDKADKKKADGKYVWKETYSGQYMRSFFVGKDTKQEDIKASFKNGELIVDVPKKEAKPEIEESKCIEIE